MANLKAESTIVKEALAGERQYIQTLLVVYGDQPSQAPGDRVRELTGLSDDINYQFGGKYVWLVPQYTTTSGNAATLFDIVIQDSYDPSKNDLAKGAGGDYRYLLTSNNAEQSQKIVAVQLFRSDSAVGGPPAGWDKITIDINKNRGKTYLYILSRYGS